MTQLNKGAKLKRSIGMPLLIFYGVGTMIGGGIYALIGKVAGSAGYYAPLSFIFSGILALLTACSYAELASRYPYSAGEAYYVDQAFHRRGITTLIGFLVILTGIVSAATLVVAINGFIQDIFPLPGLLLIFVLTAVLGLTAAWGIEESLMVVAFITLIETGALFYVFIINVPHLSNPFQLEGLAQAFHPALLNGIFLGAFLAFYAFIGFEDMVNIAEEIKDVRRILPRGILISLVITSVFYVCISWAALSVVSPEKLSTSLTPLATVIKGEGDVAEWSLRIASILTGLNGSLVQVIMASRVAYGLANLKQLPSWISNVHPSTQTPLKATALITFLILILALFFPLVTLAEITSGFILLVFALVNFSLVAIKLRKAGSAQTEITKFPLIIPVLGSLCCLIFLFFRLI